MHKYFEKNLQGRDFIIGDLHGCFDKLEELHCSINFDYAKDRMFSVGDLIDRGPRSMDCLWLINQEWFHAVRGNHEDLMLKALSGEGTKELWIMNGGAWHLNKDQHELKNLATLANELPYAITIDTENGQVGICHAQPPTGNWNDAINPTERDKSNMLWNRSWIENPLPIPRVVDNIYATYHGHTIIPKPITMGNVNFLDTGAFLEDGILSYVQI